MVPATREGEGEKNTAKEKRMRLAVAVAAAAVARRRQGRRISSRENVLRFDSPLISCSSNEYSEPSWARRTAAGIFPTTIRASVYQFIGVWPEAC